MRAIPEKECHLVRSTELLQNYPLFSCMIFQSFRGSVTDAYQRFNILVHVLELWGIRKNYPPERQEFALR